MTQEHSSNWPLIFALGSLLLMAIPCAANSQELVKVDKSLPIEVPPLVKETLAGKATTVFPQQSDQHHGPFPFASLHGFFMLGNDNIMLYHSSAFASINHPYQMIINVNITPVLSSDQYELAYDALINFGWTWITHNGEWHGGSHEHLVSHEPFTLPHFHAGSVPHFNGDISLLWTDGRGYAVHRYLQDVTLTVEKIMYFRRFDLSADYPETLTYLLFGIGSDVYMAHYLTKNSGTKENPHPLAFDDILRVNRPAWLAGQDDLLESVIEVKIPSVSVTTLPTSSPLPVGTPVNVTVYGHPSLDGNDLTVEVVERIWFDTHIVNG